MINITGYTGVLLLLAYYLSKGSISIGMFASVFYSVEKFNSISKQLIGEIGSLLRDALLGAYFYDFLDMKEKSGIDKPIGFYDEVRLKNVSFTYPGTDYKSLDNINLCIKRGETLAIVGENGAGKTTLTRIISGLYCPTEGNVYFGEMDISKHTPNTLYKSMSAIFQAFQRYQMDLKENIIISSILSGEDIAASIKKAGVNINDEAFPDGINTMLSREFGGVDLSGGQWQRVALARGFYRPHEFIILDEPTAAIDPIEETLIFNKFKEAVEGKTAILVTHRLGSAKIADKIVVIDHGKIVEMGSHNDLMAKKGRGLIPMGMKT
jgi:ATP-binding cassette subfamily B protein